MLVFPQLLSGANTQYPLTRTDVFRTALNSLADGREVKYADAGGVATRWELRLDGLTSSEWADIAALYEAVEGRLRTFTLLDPISNLFEWSEELTQPEWSKDPLLAVAAGIADPFGGTAAFRLTNAGQAPQALRQTIAGPTGFQYCCSVWARSLGGSSVKVTRGGEGDWFMPGPEWRRVFTSGRLIGATGDTFTSGFELASGESVDLFGPQLEAQLAPGAYWKSTEPGGVHPRVRFEDDGLSITATGLGTNSGILRLVSVE
jgi:hypothetical protein